MILFRFCALKFPEFSLIELRNLLNPIKEKENLMFKIEPLEVEPPQTPNVTKFEFFEYLVKDYGLELGGDSIDNVYDRLMNDENMYASYELIFLEWFELFKLQEMYSNATFSIIEEYFNGDWRKGHEVRKVVITQRLYQTSPNSTQA